MMIRTESLRDVLYSLRQQLEKERGARQNQDRACMKKMEELEQRIMECLCP